MMMDSIESSFQVVLTHCQISSSDGLLMFPACISGPRYQEFPVQVVWSVSEWFVNYHINNLSLRGHASWYGH